MLHGEIKVNGRYIGGWRLVAQRDTPGRPGMVGTYAGEVEHNGRRTPVVVEHAYDDGALVLMHKMLGAVIEARPSG